MKSQNIYHCKDGRWEGKILILRCENGKRGFLRICSGSKERVLEKMSEIHARMNAPEDRHTFREVYLEWYESIRFRVKESTLANYRMKVRRHLLPVFGDLLMTEITSKEIYDFMDRKLADGLSTHYISDILLLMKSVFKYAANCFHISNPFDNVVMPKKRSQEVKLLDSSQQETLRLYLARHPNRSTLGVALSLNTGIRIGELCALRWSDIDLEKRILTVSRTMLRIQSSDGEHKTKLIVTEPKSESSIRQIPIPDCLMGMLTRFRANADDYVLSGTKKPVEPRTMQNHFARILQEAKLPPIHFHALRHMFATNCVRLGFDIKALSELLGHSSVEITLNRYVHASLEQKEHYMNLLTLDA